MIIILSTKKLYATVPKPVVMVMKVAVRENFLFLFSSIFSFFNFFLSFNEHFSVFCKKKDSREKKSFVFFDKEICVMEFINWKIKKKTKNRLLERDGGRSC